MTTDLCRAMRGKSTSTPARRAKLGGAWLNFDYLLFAWIPRLARWMRVSLPPPLQKTQPSAVPSFGLVNGDSTGTTSPTPVMAGDQETPEIVTLGWIVQPRILGTTGTATRTCTPSGSLPETIGDVLCIPQTSTRFLADHSSHAVLADGSPPRNFRCMRGCPACVLLLSNLMSVTLAMR